MIRNKFSSRKFKRSTHLRQRFSRNSLGSSLQYKENLSSFKEPNKKLKFFKESINENLSFDETGKEIIEWNSAKKLSLISLPIYL